MTENYTCDIDYDNEKSMYFGEVRRCSGRAPFYGHTLEALWESFTNAVAHIAERDDYPDECADNVVSIAQFHANSLDALMAAAQSSVSVH